MSPHEQLLAPRSNPLTRSRTRSGTSSTGCTATIGLPWAWAIVALTIIVRMLLVPLTVRQIHSMQTLQKHAPQMKEIQKKYKGDRQKMNEELMKFYKENNINPAASCLPMLAQLPVFFALYFVLRHFAKQSQPGGDLSWLAHRPDITDDASAHWSGYLLLVDLRGQPDRVDLLHVGDDGQDAALPDDGAAARLHLLPASTSRSGSSSTG